jgi:hypothetical protein
MRLAKVVIREIEQNRSLKVSQPFAKCVREVPMNSSLKTAKLVKRPAGAAVSLGADERHTTKA